MAIAASKKQEENLHNQSKIKPTPRNIKPNEKISGTSQIF